MVADADKAKERFDVVAHVAKLKTAPLAEVVEDIGDARRALLRSLEGLDDASAQWKPAPDQWGCAEVLLHVARAEAMILGRARHLAHGDPLPERPPAPAGVPRLDELVRGLALTRVRTKEGLRSFTDKQGLDKTLDHPAHGALSWKGWLAVMAAHDRAHRAQMVRVRQAPGFPGAPAAADR